MSEKNLPPTAQRIRQARERGQIGISQDMIKLLRFAAIMELVFLADGALRAWVSTSFTVATQGIGDAWTMRFVAVIHSVTPMLASSLVVTFLAAVLTFFATLLQTGFNFAPKSFENGLQKLNPISNLQHIFSLQKLTMLLMGVFKLSLVLWVCYVKVMSQLPLMLSAYQLSATDIWTICSALLQQIERSCLVILFVLAVFDFALQRWLTYRKLRMDISEVKRDYKESEGDPHVKAHRTSEGKKMLNEPSLPKSTPSVVVVNPEHIAVALAYEFQPNTLPTIIAKERDQGAKSLRHMAIEQGIPIIKYVGLARQLYAVGRVGGFIPRQMLPAVALVYRAVQEIREEHKISPSRGGKEDVHEIDAQLGLQMLQG